MEGTDGGHQQISTNNNVELTMDTIKIISGEYKGQKIMTPGGDTHPMGERERIALFNMIGEYIPGAKVLDAYAGSGALGIEAISRGADDVLFIESSHTAMQVANMNCAMLGLPEDKVAFYRGTVSAFYKKFVQGKGTPLNYAMAAVLATFPREVDVIMADPPYDDFNGKEISRLANGYLKSGGILALSHPDEAPEFPGLELLKTHKYARAHLSIYRLK